MHLILRGHCPPENHPIDSSAWPLWQSLSKVTHQGSQCQSTTEDMPLPWGVQWLELIQWVIGIQPRISAFQLHFHTTILMFPYIHLYWVSFDTVLPLNFLPAISQANLIFHVLNSLVLLADFYTLLLPVFMGFWGYTNQKNSTADHLLSWGMNI